MKFLLVLCISFFSFFAHSNELKSCDERSFGQLSLYVSAYFAFENGLGIVNTIDSVNLSEQRAKEVLGTYSHIVSEDYSSMDTRITDCLVT